jgi:8-oxo-dGTP diphosphatase
MPAPTPRNPYPTVDIIIELPGDRIVLIERKNEPHGWAIPGGFVDYGERVEQAAVREAKEETGLDVTLSHLLGVWSDPDRDPRFHTMSVVYVASAQGEPKAGDDAAKARAFALDALPEPLCFDHGEIIDAYREWRSLES